MLWESYSRHIHQNQLVFRIPTVTQLFELCQPGTLLFFFVDLSSIDFYQISLLQVWDPRNVRTWNFILFQEKPSRLFCLFLGSLSKKNKTGVSSIMVTTGISTMRMSATLLSEALGVESMQARWGLDLHVDHVGS